MSSQNVGLSKIIRARAKQGQHGHARSPRYFYMIEGGCSFYWNNGYSSGKFPSQDAWDRACEILARYRRFCAFVEGWTPTGRIAHYADNSIEEEQRSRSGEIRWHMTLAPGGDACF